MGLIARLKALPKRWLIAVIALFVGIVASVAVLVPVLVLNKNSKEKSFAELSFSSDAVFDYVMGDEIDLSGIKIVGEKNGIKFSKDVAAEMIGLPEEGVDQKSGLNNAGVFLEGGQKTISIRYDGFELSYGVDVEEDYVVSISFSSGVGPVVENSAAEKALEGLEVYASTQRGRNFRLASSDAVVKSAYYLNGDEQVSLLRNGKIVKTNTTVYAQPFVLGIEYNFVYGKNLPVLDGTQAEAEYGSAQVVDRNVQVINTPFGDASCYFYKSVASRSDFVDVLSFSATCTYNNDEEGRIYFTDGNYLFEICSTENGLGYSFLKDDLGNPVEFNNASKREAYFVWYYYSENEFESKQLFLPFGASYAVDNGKPANATWVDEENGVFVPTENSVFFGKEREQVILLAELSYETRKDEILIKEDVYGGQKTTNIDYDAAKEASKNLKTYEGSFFVVVDENNVRHYVTKDSFVAAFAGFEKRTIYFNNFGFEDEALVEEQNGYYYLNGDLVEIANITKATGYFVGTDLVGFAIDRYYVDSLDLHENAAEQITLCGGTQVDVKIYDIAEDGFILKLSGLDNIDCSDDSPAYAVRNNNAVAVEAFGEQSGDFFVGDLISLDGFGFVLTLENGDEVVFNQDKSVRYFEENHTWSNNDFVCFGSDWSATEAKSTFDAEIKNRTNSNRACFAFVENNSNHICVYVGELGDKNFDRLNTTIMFDVDAVDLTDIALANGAFAVSGGNHFYDDLAYLLKTNTTSLNFNGSTWHKDTNREIYEVVFVDDEETYETFRHKYGNPNAFAGDERVVVLVASSSDEIVDGQLGYIGVGMWGHDATCSSKPITLVRSTRDVLYSDITIGGVLVDGDILGFGAGVWGDVVISSETESVNSSFDQITQNKMSDILSGFDYGDYVIENAGDTVRVSFSFEPNGIKSENAFEISRADYFSVSNGKPNALYANGRQLEIAGMCDYYLHVNLLSRDDVLLGRVSDFNQQLTAIDSAPSGKTTTKLIRMVFDDGEISASFSTRLAFYENVTQTFDKLYDFEKVFASETGLEKLPESGSYGVYRRVNFDSTFAGFVSTKINNFIGSAFATTGVRFANQANAGLENVAVLFDSECGSYYVLAGGEKCYVEGFDFAFEADGRYFSRVVVPSGQSKRVLYVEINEFADFGDDDYYVGVLADARQALVLCVYDESDNLVWSGTKVEDLLEQILNCSTSEVAGNYEYSKIYVQATSKFYGEGDDFEYVVESDKVGIEFFDVPHVTNGWAEENSMLVEHQALSLVPEFGSDLLSATLEENYDKIYKFPAIEIEYTSASGSGRYAAGSVLNKNLRFLPFESQGIAGEIGYSVSAYGNTIILGDYSDIGYVRIRMQYLGMEFAIDMPVCKDFVLSADYERRSFLEGSLLADNSLRFLAENCTMASGRKLGDLQSDNNGNVGTDFESLIVVKRGYDRFVLKPNELYKVIGDEYELVADANRLFSYSDGYTYTTYALTIQPVGAAYDEDSALFAAAFGNWNGTGFGKGDALASSKLTLSSDKLESVELDNIKTNYVTNIASIGLYDYFSFDDARFVFESGLEFVCPANKLSYLVARNGEIVPTQTALSTDVVLRKFELSFGERVRATGNVEVASAFVDGQAVDLSLLSYENPTRETMQVVFRAGGINEQKNINFSYVKPNIDRIDVVYSSSRTFDEGTVLSKNDIASYVVSATIVCRNVDDIVLSRAQFLNLYLQHGDNYLVQNNGTSVYVENDSFKLSDLVFGLTKAEDEMSADDILDLSFEFVEVEGGWAVKEYIGSDTEVVVPSRYRGQSVVEIGKEAFIWENIESVVIPKTIKTISDSAFQGCAKLELVLFEDNSELEEIAGKAFTQCSALESITLPASVTEFGGSCFAYCTELEDIVFETTNEQAAKDFCDELSSYYTETLWVKSAIFENVRDYVVDQEYGFFVKEIGSKEDLDRLFDFELNDNNEYVITKYKGSDVVVKIPETYNNKPVVEIGFGAFAAEIEYYEGHEGDIAYVDIDECIGTRVVRVDATSENLVTIDEYAFAQCNRLKQIDFGNSLETIKFAAFFYTSLTSIYIPASVREVTSEMEKAKEGEAAKIPAFVGCHSLARIIVDEANPWLDSRNDCNAIVETATNTLVFGCKSTIIPATVTKLANFSFVGSGIVRITIPASVTSIGERVDWIDFYDSDVTSGGCVFSNCKDLVSVVFETTSLTDIPRCSFADCTSLETIELPQGVKTIGNSVFRSCVNLAEVILPSSVEKIDSTAFKDCDSLRSVVYAGTIRQWFGIDTYVNWLIYLLPGADLYCAGQKVVNILASDLEGLEVFGGNIAGCGSVLSVEIPSSVGTISAHAFLNCENLGKIVFAGDTTIVDDAFYLCKGIETVTLKSQSLAVLEAQCLAISKNRYVYELDYNSVFAGTVYVDVDDSTFDALESYMNSVQYSFEIVNKGGDVPPGPQPPEPQPGEEDFVFAFSDFSQSSYVVTGYNGEGGDVVIPSTHDGLPVVRIGWFAFSGCTGLTSITIPSSVTSIGYGVFSSCHNLATVTFEQGSKLQTISEGAFQYCDALTSITIPASVTSIGGGAFQDCDALTSITIPVSVTSIGEGAFSSCDALTSITISASVTSIGGSAFNGCDALATVTFEQGSKLATIGNGAFDGCTALTSITIPASVTTIEGGSFENCTGLATVTFEQGSKLTTIGGYAFRNCDALTSITIPNSVTTINPGAFAECYSLVNVTLPNNLKIVEQELFRNCESLRSIVIPSTVEYIAYEAFLNCGLLSNVVFEKTAAGSDGILFGGTAFYGCDYLTELEFPSGLFCIGYESDYGLRNLRKVTYRYNRVIRPGTYFEDIFNNEYAEPVRITEDFYVYTDICNFLLSTGFEGTLYLKAELVESAKEIIRQYDSVHDVYNYPFNIVSVDEEEEDTVTSGSFELKPSAVGDGWIINSADVTDGTTCTVPENYQGEPLLVLARGAVDSDTMTVFDAGNSNLTTIENFAFLNAPELTTIILPESVTSIGENAFDGCDNLETIVLKSTNLATVNSLVGDISSNGYSGVVEVDPSIFEDVVAAAESKGYDVEFTPNWSDDAIDDAGFVMTYLQESDSYEISGYEGDATRLSLPGVYNGKPVTAIGDEAFYWYYCRNLASVDLSACTSLTTIGRSAFRNHQSLSSVDLSGCTSLEIIGKSAFYECHGLESIDLSGCTSLKTIGDSAFGGCISLVNVDLSGCTSLTTIGGAVFDSCRSLTSIDLSDCTSLETIVRDAFLYSGLTSITIPNSVITIGDKAFIGCESLVEIVLETDDLERAKDLCDGIESSYYKEIVYVYGSGLASQLDSYVREKGYGFSVQAINFDSVLEFYDIDDETCGVSGYNGQYRFVEIPATHNGKRVTTVTFGFGSVQFESVTLPNSIVTIAQQAFSYNRSLKSVDLTNCTALTTIGGGAFSNCENLTNVSIPESVTTIGDGAFSGCSSLESINIPSGVTELGKLNMLLQPGLTTGVFRDCTALKTVEFAGDGNLVTIGFSAFVGCTSLTSITIPEGVTTIGDGAFSGCSSLVDVKIPNSLAVVGSGYMTSGIFSGCSSLESIDFSGCTSLTAIGGYAFSGCSSLTNIKLPSGLTGIGEGAFSGCSSLTRITIPSGVTNICDRTFYDCISLASITFPNGLTGIGSHAFYGCINLSNVVFTGNNIALIGHWAFAGCSSLTTIQLPSAVDLGTSIGQYAFSESGLTNIRIPYNYSLNDRAFADCERLVTAYVPDGTMIDSYIPPNAAYPNGHHYYVFDEGVNIIYY